MIRDSVTDSTSAVAATKHYVSIKHRILTGHPRNPHLRLIERATTRVCHEVTLSKKTTRHHWTAPNFGTRQ